MKWKNFAIATGLCLLVAASLFVVGTKEAGALPSNETEIFWLDADGNEVGYYFRGCNGQRISEGVQSEYRLRHSTACSTINQSTGCTVNLQPVSCADIPFRCIYIGGRWSCGSP